MGGWWCILRTTEWNLIVFPENQDVRERIYLTFILDFLLRSVNCSPPLQEPPAEQKRVLRRQHPVWLVFHNCWAILLVEGTDKLGPFYGNSKVRVVFLVLSEQVFLGFRIFPALLIFRLEFSARLGFNTHLRKKYVRANSGSTLDWTFIRT